MQWNISRTGSSPDLISEANRDSFFFRRLQYEVGGVGYNIESKGDPVSGEFESSENHLVYYVVHR